MKTSVVLTSISKPNLAMNKLSLGCIGKGYSFIIIGDEKSSEELRLYKNSYYSLRKQKELGFKFTELCPTNNYARKNIGYLLAKDSDVIIETDDDNEPFTSFWFKKEELQDISITQSKEWLNVYRFFSNEVVWPRGFPLKQIKVIPYLVIKNEEDVLCPVQQNFVDGSFDVDAIYRMTHCNSGKLNDVEVALGLETWCPFNSQNTTWFKRVFKLMYLPAYCSFRMSDIWRSFIAQVIMHKNNMYVSYHSSSMLHNRNYHPLMEDFEQEIIGYLKNDIIIRELNKLSLKVGTDYFDENLNICYEKMISMDLVDKKELILLNSWLKDFSSPSSEMEKSVSSPFLNSVID